MKNKYKYVLVITIFVIVSIIIIRFPSFYFDVYDKNSTNKYQIDKINLSNNNDSYHLSNNEKIGIMMNSEGKYFSMKEEVNRKKYDQTLDAIHKELEKLDADLLKLFDEELRLDYNAIAYANFDRIYLSSDSSNSLILRNIDYENDDYYISITMDIYDDTILRFYVYTRLDDSLQFDDDIKIYENFKNYLDISYDVEAFTFVSGSELYLGLDCPPFNGDMKEGGKIYY